MLRFDDDRSGGRDQEPTMHRSIRRRLLISGSLLAGALVTSTPLAPAAAVLALDNTPWVVPAPPARCTTQQAASGNVAGCVLTFYADPATTGWGAPPAPGIGEGWTWNGYRYNGSPALAAWESTYVASNSGPVGGLRAGTLQTHVAAQALFEGFLDEISAKGYRVRDASGYSFRCTSANGGWSCPSGDPDDLSNHAWGLAIDMNAGTNPIRSYSSIDGVTACQTPIQTDMPKWVIETAEKWGLYWGGYGWNSGCPTTDTLRTIVSRDPPHFEFRGTPAQAAAIAAHNLANDPNAYCTIVVDDAGAKVERCTNAGLPQAGWRLPVDLDAPPGAVAAMINLTATEATAPGFLTLEDCAARSGARSTSAINYAAGDSVASMAVVPLAPDGTFCVYRSSPVHSIVDVTAFLGSQGEPMWFEPATPRRLTDTRIDGVCAPGGECRSGRPNAGDTHAVPASDGIGRIVNLTAVDAPAPGWLQVGRCSDVGPAGAFSNLNVSSPAARANVALVPPGEIGTCAFTHAGANVIVDEFGLLNPSVDSTGLGWKLAPPRRAIDTRQCSAQWCSGRPAAGQLVRVDLGVDAPAAAVSVVVTEPAGPGFATVGRCSDLADGGAGRTSNVNYERAATVAGLALVALEDGAMCVYTLASAHVVVDVQAELTRAHTVGVLPVDPTRSHDSRTT
jgi:hypothetical protein